MVLNIHDPPGCFRLPQLRKVDHHTLGAESGGGGTRGVPMGKGAFV
jgi:hypothetical protein